MTEASTPALPDPTPLEARGNALLRWVGPAISLAILVVVIWSLRTLNWADVVAVVPTSPAFWALFVIVYFLPVACDFLIFRYLWKIPAEGFIALTRKQVGNELLLGYVGEVYFYGWSRRKIDMKSSPFGAVKDVAILSALAGNIVTLAMIAIAYPLVTNAELAVISQKLRVSEMMLAGSIALVVLVPMLALLFGRRLFSLTGRQLGVVSAIHMTRIIVNGFLAALCWSLALPEVDLSWWVILATVRLLISRLPLITQKDIVFAGVAVFLVGRDLEIAALIAFWAAIQLVANLGLGAILSVADFVTVEKPR